MDEFSASIAAVDHLLCFLSPSDWAVLCLTSETLRDTIRSIMSTRQFCERICRILGHRLTQNQTQIQCRQLISLVNSLNFPLELRLQYFTELTKQKESFPVNGDSIVPTMDLSYWAGTMLQSFMDGCQVDEYHQLELFASAEATVNACEKSRINENFLRAKVRQLFLDPCSSRRHKAIWLGIIADYIGTKPFARLIILLYGPTNLQGDLDWSFHSKARSSRLHSNVYVSLAETLALLPFIPNWARSRSTKILAHISNHPVSWSLRSFASLMLPLSRLCNDLAVDYFVILYNTRRHYTAAIIIALTLALSGGLDLNDRQIPNVMPPSADSVLKTISHVINDPRLCLQRSVINQQLWDAVRNVAADLVQTAANNGEDASEAAEDFRNLMRVWKELFILQICSQ